MDDLVDIDNPGSLHPAGSSIAKCSGTLIVNVHWGNDANVHAPYMKDSHVKVGGIVAISVKGPTERTVKTTNGTHAFENLPCGDYSVGVAVERNSPLVNKALTYVGKTHWAYMNSITSLDDQLSLPSRTNKCNFFIYDMIQQTYGSAPLYSYRRGGSWSPFWKTVPALAGSWARFDNSDSDPTEGWKNIRFKPPGGTDPVAPGSILAIGASYSDATGHVGIVAYPDRAIGTAKVAGAKHTVTVIMPGKTISAAGDKIVHNNWGFRTSDHMEKNSLNSPAAGIEVRK